jgi:hypothetical protein
MGSPLFRGKLFVKELLFHRLGGQGSSPGNEPLPSNSGTLANWQECQIYLLVTPHPYPYIPWHPTLA